MASARKPIASDSPSAITPRITGKRQIRRLAIGEAISFTTWAIAPSGLRTATAQLDGERIITPSRTAWPPIAVAMGVLAALAGLGALELALEALDAAAGVHELLLARVEGMTGRADLDVQLGLRRAGLELVPARAAHGREHVLRVNVGLHRRARIAEAVSGAALPPETTSTTVSPGSREIFPARRAAVEAAPAGPQASFARA